MSRVAHFEIAVDQPQKSIDFYKNVFGWKVDKWDGPVDYWLVTTGDGETPGIDGALAKRKDIGQPITVILEVEDAAGYMEKVKANGGEAVGDLIDIPGIGISGYFRDPAGNLLGVMQLTGQSE